jgi:hypothetical protein
MKNISITLISLLLTALQAFPQQHAEYQSTLTIMQSLNYCYDAMILEKADTGDVVADLTEVNSIFNNGLAKILPLISSNDTTLAKLANTISSGIEMHRKANERMIDIFNTVKREGSIKRGVFASEMEKHNEQAKTSWELIGKSAAFTYRIFSDAASLKKVSGEINFKVSLEEKKSLLLYIDSHFKTLLAKFHAEVELERKGIKANPEDQNWLAFGIDSIRRSLQCNTYEELFAKE